MDNIRFHVTFCTFFREKNAFEYLWESYEEYVLFCVRSGSFLYGFGETPSHMASAGDIVICAPGQEFYRQVLSSVSFCMIKFSADNMPCYENGLVKVTDTVRLFHDIAMLETSAFCTEIAAEPVLQHFCNDIVYQLIAAAKETETPLQEAVEYIHRYYTTNIVIEELAARCGYSTVHFINLFRKYYGSTPKAYISLLRMNTAKNLLANSKHTISEISGMCGFSDPLYFSRFFRSQFQMSPATYRKTIVRNRKV